MQRMKPDMWQMTYDIPDTWNMTGGEHCVNMSGPKLNLMV